jgi:hypothetical protein
MGFINGRWRCPVRTLHSYSNDHGDWNVLHETNLPTYNETLNVITEWGHWNMQPLQEWISTKLSPVNLYRTYINGSTGMS